MALSSGTRLGAYEVAAQIGEGGMGEVYRARDTKLHRDVALKILPSAFAADPDRLARFKREAQVLASLNHPHIAAIYGFEDADGVHALVLELVEGPTLADRIEQGPIPIDEALPIARQIAEALEAAHEQGIIHRDLKPANIKVRADGMAKVLDFGLAKLTDGPGETGGVGSTAVSQSPTITTPAMTMAGTILGTAAYLSPEQAKGRPADKRSDLWAFGCVLYEMLTGKRAFEGEGVSDTLAAVLRGTPDWSALPRGVDANTRTTLKGCLEKDRNARLSNVAIVQFLLRAADVADDGKLERRKSPSWAMAAVAAILVAGASATIAWTVARSRVDRPRVTRLMIPWSATDTADTITQFQISPDGGRIAYITPQTGSSRVSSGQLMVRSLDRLEPEPVRGVTRAIAPFWSPDGKWIGFFQPGTPAELRKVPVAGGPSIPICRVAFTAGWPVAASWGSNDTIVFTSAQQGGVGPALFRVAAKGGEPVSLTETDPAHGEAADLFPFVLPGGHAALYSIALTSAAPSRDRWGLSATAVVDLDTGRHHIIIGHGTMPMYLPTGHVVYFTGGSLVAAGFDLQSQMPLGEPLPLVEGVRAGPFGPEFSVAADGTLAYVAGTDVSGAATGRSLTWVDRTGRQDTIPAPPRAYAIPRLSPDDTQIALDIRDQENDIWIWDIARRILRQLTLDPASDLQPLWTLDGQRLLFASNRDHDVYNVFWQKADGTGTTDRLTTATNPQFPQAIGRDPRQVVLLKQSPQTGNDLMLLTLGDKPQVEGLVQTAAGEANPSLSPDGRWLAYSSGGEIFVRPFPDVTAGQWRVSTNGGTRPVWARNGKELFYGALDGAMMALPVQTEHGFTWGNAVKLFDWPTLDRPGFGRTFDVSADGQRFVMIKEPDERSTASDAPGIVVVSNWFEEVKQHVPTK